MSATASPVPQKVLSAALYTLYRAMVFCRNYSGDRNAAQDVVYDLMDALHEIPEILRRWGTSDNNVEKLKLYFGCFHHEKWRERSQPLRNNSNIVSLMIALACQAAPKAALRDGRLCLSHGECSGRSVPRDLWPQPKERARLT